MMTISLSLNGCRKDGITIEDSLEAPNPSLVRYEPPLPLTLALVSIVRIILVIFGFKTQFI